MSFNINLLEGWEIKKLSDIVDRVKVGFVGTCNKYYCDKNEGIPMIRTTNLSKNGVVLDDIKYISREFYDKNKKSQLKKGDILIARHGSNGLASLWDKNIQAQCLNVVIVETNNILCNPVYLTYAINSPFVNNQILSMVGGSVQGVVNTKSIAEVLIPYPSLNEQEKIAYILSSFDKKLKINEKINNQLEEMSQAIFKQWFVDFEFPNENGEPYKSSGGEMVESEMGMIPKEWEITTLNEICYFNRETYSSKETLDYINYLDTSNITKNKIDTIQKIDCYSEKIPSRAKRKVTKDSIVYSTVRPNQLHYGIIKEPIKNMIVSTGFVVIDSKVDFVNSDLIYLWLTQNEVTAKLQAIGETSTSTYPSIKPSDIKSIKIIFPKISVINAVTNIFSKIYLSISTLNDENKKLSELRDNLLPKLMSGEIRVPLNN